jgi:pentatricopeptide repeat protein
LLWAAAVDGLERSLRGLTQAQTGPRQVCVRMTAFVHGAPLQTTVSLRRRAQCTSRTREQHARARRQRTHAQVCAARDVLGHDLGDDKLDLSHGTDDDGAFGGDGGDGFGVSDALRGSSGDGTMHVVSSADAGELESRQHAGYQTNPTLADPAVLDGAEAAVDQELANVPAIISPQAPRSSRDPHVASQSAYAAHVAQVSNQPHDPRTAMWRRQNAVLVEEARRHGVDAALEMLWEISEQDRAASQNFNQVVSLLAADGRLQDGLDLALEAGKREFANIITFRPLMKLCCSSGDGRAAKRVWRAMVDCGVEGDMFLYAELMGALVRSQDTVSAERVLQSLHESGRRPHIVLYNTLLKGIAKQAKVQHAFDVLDSIIEAGVKPDETTFNTILNTCVRAKDLDALNHVMSLMRDHKIKPGVPTFNTLLKLYARAGKFQDALDIFEEMQQTVQPSIVTYNTLIDGCAHRGDMDRAAVFFDEMLERGMSPDICTMTSLLKGFGRSNNPVRAVELYEAMKEGGYQIEERTRYAVINACLRGNDRDNARRLMREMVDSNVRIRARTWIWMLETDIWCDDEYAALATLREMDVNGVFMDPATKNSLLRETRERGNFLRFQRELKASRTTTVAADRRRDD